MKKKLISLALLCGFLLASLSGCDFFDLLFGPMKEAAEWADSKGINPQNPDGSLNGEGLVNLGAREVSGTGNPEADAALDTKKLIVNILKTEKLMGEAFKTGDIKKMDEAIKLRPQDLSLHAARAAIFLAGGGNQVEAMNELWYFAPGEKRAETDSRYRIKIYALEQAWPLVKDKSFENETSHQFRQLYCEEVQKYTKGDENLYKFYYERTKKMGIDCKRTLPYS